MTSSPRRMLLALAAALLVLLTGCAGGVGGMSSSEEAADAGAADAAVRADLAGDPARARGPEVGGAALERPPVTVRAVIRTGQVAVVAGDLDRARAEVDTLLATLGGTLDSERTGYDRRGRVDFSALVLRVPVARFDEAMEALARLGKVRHAHSSARDVTTEVIDVDERVETLQNSLDRLQRYQRTAADIDDLVRFEEQITQRQAELQSLQAQQAYLADQTTMATIRLTLSAPDRPAPPPDGLDDAGFWVGLAGGWSALKDTVVVALTVLGALLPFLVVLVLVGAPVWLAIRARPASRRARSQ